MSADAPTRPGPEKLASSLHLLRASFSLGSTDQQEASMSVTVDPLAATQTVAEAYGAAWNAHDLDAITAMHAEGMAFQLHVQGFEEAATPEAVHGQFSAIFAAWPDLHFATVRLTVAPDLFVHEFTISGTLAAPWPVGDEVAQPSGRHIAFPGVDVIRCTQGKVLRKDTYLDAVALRAGLGL
jgi:hypothetical protein